MGLFNELFKAAAKQAIPKAGQYLKDMLDPDSEFNMKPGIFGSKYLEKRAKNERARAEFEQAKYDRLVAQNQNETFDHRRQILSDLRALEVREKEIELELKRLPISEIESKTRLYEEMAKNKEAYGKILMLKKQLESLQ